MSLFKQGGVQMPQVRKLAPAEVETLEYKSKGQRKLVEEQYNAILSDYAVGDYGEAVLEPEEKRLTVRNRLIAAAKRRDVGINFRRTKSELLRFQIVAHENGEAVPEVAGAAKPMTAATAPAVPAPAEPEPAPKRRGGRPKKTA